MDNLESLTDSELRHRLIQYGFPNVPITGTTRKLLIKKLRNHLNNEKSKLHKETAFATRYSSDEESEYQKLDNNSKPSRSTYLSRSTTTRYSSNNIKNNINNNNIVMPPPKSPPVTTTVRRSVAPSSNLGRTSINRNYYDYDYQSNIEKSSPPPLSRVYVSPVIKAPEPESEDSDYDYYNSDKQNNNTTSRYQSSYLMTPDRTQTNCNLPDYLNDSDYNDNSINGSINIAKPQPQLSSNYMSDFTHRLLKLRGETLKTNTRKTTVPVTTFTPRFSRNYLANKPDSYYTKDNTPKSKSLLSNLLNKFNVQSGFKHSFIPYLLIGVLVIFFSILILMYLTMHPDIEATLTEKNTSYELCSEANSDTAISTITCINGAELKGTLELIKTIAPILHDMAIEYKCKDNTKSYLLTGADVIRFGKQSEEINNSLNLRMLLRNMEYLIDLNPHWNLCNVNDKGEKLKFKEVLNMRSQFGNYFAVLEPQIPLSCRIYYRMKIFFLLIGSFGILLFVCSIFYFTYKFIQNHRKSKQDKISYFINEIISHLMRKAAYEPDNPSIVINHLRDKLIPLHKRKAMEYAWNEAVNYLESNESRIQFEIAIINGEDCKILKWIDTVSSDQIQLQQQQQHQLQQPQRTTIKKWQSPAFDKAANKIVNPPTSCLKIRQMFDKFEASNDNNLKTNIQDAILEKVGPQCKIYDIVLDKQTCCVYVRCATEKDAGIVHNEINGWWFDKRLVSIKFLRLERFLNRFPKSASSICLYPSNSKKLSMPTKIEYCEDDDDSEN